MGSYLNPLTNAPRHLTAEEAANYNVQTQPVDPQAPYGFGNTDPTSDARRAAYLAQNPAPEMQIDTTGLSVQPDINGSYTGYVNINGAPTRISITNDGTVFDETGRNITSRFSPQNLTTLRGAYAQTSGDAGYSQGLQQAAAQPQSGPTAQNPGAQGPEAPGTTPSGPSGPSGPSSYQGFVPFDPKSAPNAGYQAGPGQTGGGNGYQNFKFGFNSDPVNAGSQYGYGVQPLLDQSGNRIDEKIANDRAMAYAKGDQLGQDLTNYTNYYQGQASDFGDQLASAYDPSNPANMGYTDPEKNAILNDPYLRSLQLSPEQAQSNYLTEGEQQGIQGDPYAPWNYASQAANQLDQENNDFNNTIRTALNNQDYAINGVTNNTANSVRGAVGNQVNAEMGAYNQGYGNVQNALGQEGSYTRQYVDPSKLTASPEYLQNYNVTDRDVQNIKDRAGRSVGMQELADEDALQRAAAAQGNTSPLALATMRDRMRQTGEVNRYNALTDAEIQGRQLQLGTTQNRENTRLGAEQNYAGLGTGTELALGNQNVNAQQGQQAAGIGVASDLGAASRGAEQYLGNQQLQAQQYLGSSRIGAEQSNAGRTVSTGQFNSGLDVNTLANSEANAASRAAQTAGNRQAVNQYNQGQDFTRGQYIYGNESAANTNFANTRLGGLTQYRQNYLMPMQQQANQNVQVGNQQRGTNFATTGNLANQASGNAITNYRVPGFGNQVFTDVTQVLGAVPHGAKGGVTRGPQMALVGEAGPELIVDLDQVPQYGSGGVFDWQQPYDQDGYQGGWETGGGFGQGGDSGETDFTGSGLPTDDQTADPRYADRNKANPLWKRIIGSLAPNTGLSTDAEVDPSKQYNPFGTTGVQGGGPAMRNLLQLGIRKSMGMAAGGVVSPHHPYGKRGMPKMPHMELVTKPQIRTLGKTVPQAVVPLRRKPGNKVNLEDIPSLIEKFGR